MSRFIYRHASVIRHRISASLITALTLCVLPGFSFANDRPFTKPLDALTAYQQRPLFSPARRLQAIEIPNEVAPQPVTGQTLNAALLGVISTNDGAGLAILRVEGQPDAVRIHVGESIEGWQLDAIDPHHAIFSSGYQKITLTFPTGKTDGASAPAPNDGQMIDSIVPSDIMNP